MTMFDMQRLAINTALEELEQYPEYPTTPFVRRTIYLGAACSCSTHLLAVESRAYVMMLLRELEESLSRHRDVQRLTDVVRAWRPCDDRASVWPAYQSVYSTYIDAEDAVDHEGWGMREAFAIRSLARLAYEMCGGVPLAGFVIDEASTEEDLDFWSADAMSFVALARVQDGADPRSISNLWRSWLERCLKAVTRAQEELT